MLNRTYLCTKETRSTDETPFEGSILITQFVNDSGRMNSLKQKSSDPRRSPVEEAPYFTPPESVNTRVKEIRRVPDVTITDTNDTNGDARRESLFDYGDEESISSDDLLDEKETDSLQPMEGQLGSGGLDKSHKSYQFTFTPSKATLSADENKRRAQIEALDRKKVKKMHTAVRLNQKLQELSSTSQLVILNLPKPPHSRLGLLNYIEYLEVLTDKLERVLLVRGSGKEVITMYS